MKTNSILILNIILITFFFTSCSDLIEFSPYEAHVNDENYNLKVINQFFEEPQRIGIDTVISGIDQIYFEESVDTLMFAVFSDSHTNYNSLNDAIKIINNIPGLSFVVSVGDVTDKGTAQEFNWYLEAIKKCQYPLVTVIGNHDYRSNGKIIFNRMFGPTNSSFFYGQYKFILFDDVVWENDNSSPDFAWLQNEITDNQGYNVIFSHISPFSDQLKDEYQSTYNQVVNSTNTILNIHGHDHIYKDTIYNNYRTVLANSVLQTKEFYIVKLIGKYSEIKTISY